MQKKLLIPILVVLVIVIVLITRGCGIKDTKQEARQEEPQDTVADLFDDASAAGNDVRAQFGTMTADENGGVDITVEADGTQTTYTYTDVASDAWYADAVNYHELSEFFLAWDKKLLMQAFPDWYADSKRILAVRGD